MFRVVPLSGLALRGRSWLESALAEPLAGMSARTPNPKIVALFATALGIGLIVLFRFGPRFGLELPMFRKEGFAENLTFLLELWAATLCGLAAYHVRALRRPGATPLVEVAYWLCAAALVLVAMEEISWGQQLLGFSTPGDWRTINHQQETTLHNLLSRDELTFTWQVVGVAFGAGSLGLTVSARMTDSEVLHWIAPHASLAPLALLTGYAAARVHPEMAELLISLFFAFYAYRIYVASWTAPRRRGPTGS